MISINHFIQLFSDAHFVPVNKVFITIFKNTQACFCLTWFKIFIFTMYSDTRSFTLAPKRRGNLWHDIRALCQSHSFDKLHNDSQFQVKTRNKNFSSSIYIWNVHISFTYLRFCWKSIFFSRSATSYSNFPCYIGNMYILRSFFVNLINMKLLLSLHIF